MKKFFYILLSWAGLLTGLVGCSSSDDMATGEASLGVEIQSKESHPSVITRAGGPDVNTFPIEILEEGNPYKQFNSFQELKNAATLKVSVGKSYVVKAHQPGNMQEMGDVPYYAGESASVTMVEGFNPVAVVCHMQNVKVKIILTPELVAKIQDDYAVQVSNGTANGVWNLTSSDFSTTPYESSLKYFKPSASGSLTIILSGNSNEYDPAEPFRKEESIKVSPNDDLTVTFGIENKQTKAVGAPVFNIKMTVVK